MKNLLPTKRKIALVLIILLLIFAAWLSLLGSAMKNRLASIYDARQSVVIYDRNGEIIAVKPNPQGHYAIYSNDIPPRLKELLLEKEDKYFYSHFGVNPVSNLRAFYNFLIGKKNVASSTITQQLVKILLQKESDRTLQNKFTEALYAFSLEINTSKEDILEMYVNSIYLGNNVQGIDGASRLYFNSSADLLGDEQILELLSTISSPTNSNPFAVSNPDFSRQLGKRLNVPYGKTKPLSEEEIYAKEKAFRDYARSVVNFELDSLGIDCQQTCYLTIDKSLNERVREITKRNLLSMTDKDASNGSVVIIKLPENELLAVVGSPAPEYSTYGYQINMAKMPRSIGSTIKPFIYLKGFEKGLRPYTLVEDKEYKYTIGSGFAFYPKNYDYRYHGTVNLHYALTNSLNVPAVKVLEYAELDDFYGFLIEDLQLHPIQNLDNYQLGIALGELETDLMTLSYYFTIFPNEGYLNPLKVYANGKSFNPPSATGLSESKKIAEKRYIELINKILSDRKTGVEQFGLKSDLNLFQNNYAVKTGTSREYHDSWTMGYTPDFLVGVWVGNSDDTPMKNISGQSGAGRIWHETMNFLINSPYNKKTPFPSGSIEEFGTEDGIQYGLANDDFETSKRLLENNNLIMNPHDGDTFLLEKDTRITLKSLRSAQWHINDKPIGEGKEIIFAPADTGSYRIRAKTKDGEEETVTINMENED